MSSVMALDLDSPSGSPFSLRFLVRSLSLGLPWNVLSRLPTWKNGTSIVLDSRMLLGSRLNHDPWPLITLCVLFVLLVVVLWWLLCHGEDHQKDLIISSELSRWVLVYRDRERNTSYKVAERRTSRSCSKKTLCASESEASMSRGTQASLGSAQELTWCRTKLKSSYPSTGKNVLAWSYLCSSIVEEVIF